MRSTVQRCTSRSLALVMLLVALVGCSVSTEESAVRIPTDQVPFQLNAEATTTSVGVSGTTTTVPRNEVEIYLVRDDRLAVVRRDAVASDPQGVLSLLAAGPTEQEIGAGLRTALVADLAVIVRVADQLVTIDLTAGFTELAPLEQRLALAQITYSVTQLPAINDVRFLVAGQDASVPRGDGSSTDRPVTPGDYAEFAPI